MGFGNPAAWFGLVLLAGPVAGHLLVRDRARSLRLPTLRFLEGAPPVAVRWSRPADPLLLLLRLAIVALAVAALARPFLPSDTPPDAALDAPSASPERVILVDESASMLRRWAGAAVAGPEAASESVTGAAAEAGGSGSALARARDLAAELARTTPGSRVVPFGSGLPLDRALAGASAWLATRPGPGEIVVISDFQQGTLPPVPDTSRGPTRVAVAVEVDAEEAVPWRLPTRAGGLDVTAVLDSGGAPPGTVLVTWSPAPGGGADAGPGVELLHDPADATRARTLLDALQASGALVAQASFPVSVRLAGWDGAGGDGSSPDAPGGREAEPGTAAFSPEVGSLLLRLASDPVLAGAASVADARPDGRAMEARPGLGEPGAGQGAAPARVVLARAGTGAPLVLATPGQGGGLILDVRAAPGSLVSAALLAALGRGLFRGPPGAELDPRTVEPDALEQWAQAPAAASPDAEEGTGRPTDDAPSSAGARGAWLLVLLLLAGESLYRRRIHEQRA
jgi:hypothetical protein